MKIKQLIFAGLFVFSLNAPAAGALPTNGLKTFIDYFQPTPIIGASTARLWTATACRAETSYDTSSFCLVDHPEKSWYNRIFLAACVY
jgi:hypothetical protein